MGRSILGLGYAIFLCELVLAAFVPSNTARGGGIVMPIVLSIAFTLGSTPDRDPRKKGGEYLMLCGAHANLLAASFYPTGMPIIIYVSNVDSTNITYFIFHYFIIYYFILVYNYL
jgi:di/tricarboxylate transporter